MSSDLIIYNQDFVVELNYVLEKEYKNSKILIVCTYNIAKLLEDKIGRITKEVITNNLVLPNETNNTVMFRKLMEKECTEDLKAVVVIGSGNISDMAKSVCSDYDLPYVLVPTACSSAGYLLDFVFCFDNSVITIKKVSSPEIILVDQQVIAKTPHKMVASAYGMMVSSFAVLLDVVFGKTIYNGKADTKVACDIENILKDISRLPTNIIKTPLGINELFKNMLSLELLLNEVSYLESSVFSVSMLTYSFVQTSVGFGEISIVNTMLLMRLYESFFSINNLNKNVLPNIHKRINKLRLLTGTYSTEIFDDTMQSDRDSSVFKFMSVKDKYQLLCQRYIVFVENAFKVFKSFYNDKGTWLKKQIKSNTMLNAIAVAPDIYKANNILTFMRNFGLLDIN